MRGSVVKKGKTYSFIIDIGKVNGKRKQKWFNGYKTKKEAQNELTEVLSQLKNNSYIEPSKITLSEFLEKWLEECAKPNVAVTTYSGYAVNVNKHINPVIGHIVLQELQPIQIQNFYNNLAKNGKCNGTGGLSPRSIQYIHMVLRQALEYAYKMQLIPRNVADMTKIPKQKKYIANFLLEEEIEQLLKIFKDTQIYMPVLLAVGIGLRRGEALALKWSNVNFATNTITISENLIPTKEGCIFSTPKTDSSKREIVVPKFIINELILLKEKQDKNKILLGKAYTNKDLVCCYDNGNNFNPGAFSHLFSDILARNNFRHIRFHDLRHTNATLMLKSNVSPKVASARLGHSKTSTTLDIYSHVVKELQEDTAKKLNNFFTC